MATDKEKPIAEQEKLELFTRLGFTLHRSTKDINFYTLPYGDKSVELTDHQGCISLALRDDLGSMDIALRYKCATMEQLEFILFSGRIGYIFKPILSYVDLPKDYNARKNRVYIEKEVVECTIPTIKSNSSFSVDFPLCNKHSINRKGYNR